ncbi:MAG: glycosyltransferase family 4 protein, partial [candidate division KSB1 bacterium]|nr:glycosyltransferase family 4 protein [candidate division KSB1 bacterium]
SCFFIPDARIGWLPFALACGMKIIRQETIEVIYSSAPPYTCHLIGFWLKKITGKPWVADFRDSWVGWLSAPRRPVLPAKLDRYLERSVLKWADKILTVSKGVAQDLGSRNPNLMDSRWHLLPNGYDGADFEGVQAFPSNNKFVITYTGSLYGHRNPYYFLQAIAELMAEAEDLRQYLQLTFVGRMGRSIEDMLRDSRFEGLVKIVPYVSHRESLQYLLSSDVLLLIIDDAPANKGILTGKLFEYLGARKPLLALAPEGEAAELIREVKAGVVAHPANVEEVKQALRYYYQNWKDHTLSSEEMDVDKIQAFDRRELARRLADILDRVVSHAFNHRSLNKSL